jgi:type IV pilus assembly protein PilQ
MNARNTIFDRRFFGRLGSVCVLCAFAAAPALGQAAPGGDDQQVEVTDYGTVTLSVRDTDLADILEMLSIQSQKNIIASKNVSAVIPSVNLFDVTFHEALDAILRPNGYGYIEEGNFIYIYTQAELEEMKAAQRKTESRVFELQHLSASDANEFITPMLSEVGQSVFRGDVEPGIQPDISAAGEDSYAFAAKLLVTDYPERLEEIAERLEELDKSPEQVLLEATILQTTLNEDNAFGIDFSVMASVDFTDLTNPLSGVNNLLGGSDEENGFQPADNEATIVNSTPGNTAGPGTFKVGVLTDDIGVFLRVLDQVTDSAVLARPKLMALNRQRAEVLVGARVGYLSTTATETTSTETVEYLDTGIKLTFRPFISDNGTIRLELAPSVSEAQLRTVTNTRGIAVTIPDQLTNEVTTNVRVKDGQTLVLGGLFRERNQVTRRQVPVLGDIPVLGAAFRGQDDSIEREEIIFLITPSVVHDEALWAMGADALNYTDDLVIGSRQGLLPFSRTRQTDNHNNRAMEAFEKGNVDEALYHINNSLRLAPNQPEMVKFRQRVMGVKESAYERSMIERVIRKELGPLGAEESYSAAFSRKLDDESFFEGMRGVTAGFQPERIGSSSDQANETVSGETSTQPTFNDENEADFDDEFANEDAEFDDEFAAMDDDMFDREFASVWSNDDWAFDDAQPQAAPENATASENQTPEDALQAQPEANVANMTEQEKQRFIDRFVQEYFAAMGLAYIAPDDDDDPFGELDKSYREQIVEAQNEERPID